MALCIDTFDSCKIKQMKQIEFVRKLALSLPETTEAPHFEKTSFRVKKKIFATYDQKENKLCLKFSEIDQNVFSAISNMEIYPVPNKWGKQGWTFIQLDCLSNALLKDALTTAYCEVAPKKIAEHIRPKDED